MAVQVGLKSSAEPERLFSIGEVAGRAGVRTSALRYYEQAGLLQPATRIGGQRRYDRSAFDQLRLIRFCQRLGFSLDEVRQLLTPPRGKAAKRRWRDLVDVKLSEAEAAIASAREMKALLAAARDCDCVRLDACRFLDGDAHEKFDSTGCGGLDRGRRLS